MGEQLVFTEKVRARVCQGPPVLQLPVAGHRNRTPQTCAYGRSSMDL